ncbi:MAG TPA: hypothetical protein VL547_07720 [Dinghuibacter sp.]|uniref:hypothetical protein n=1 Tax=Dinghuibacter sp. TaxID=2024697 RepID=UPI002B673D17|nr:hypothetical protein [Dinghuibacter sp.]HTJ11896.1 hypothetical protein [Dinghuibacter sp.]
MPTFMHVSNRLAILCAGLILLWANGAAAQGIRAFNGNVDNVLASEGNTYHDMFKASLIYAHKKGLSIGLSYGYWKETDLLQYSMNTGLMYRFFPRFLGNYYNVSRPRDSRSKGQLVFMFSPLLTCKISRRNYVYQEIEPFYLGTPNSVFCRYKSSFTLGTTFTVSPRGTFNNVATVRNRSQQVFMLALNIKDFNFTMYDDYFTWFTEKLQLGDNWDRFFTGGGFVRYRVNSELTLHIYSEVYTGINRAIPFLYPDIISYKPKKRGWLLKNYANQDLGQEFFNTSWFVLEASYSSFLATFSAPRVFSGCNTTRIAIR